MNRIVLIGNGFDLAHGLKTRYEDFINWYCDLRVYGFVGNLSDISSDILCSFQDLRHVFAKQRKLALKECLPNGTTPYSKG